MPRKHILCFVYLIYHCADLVFRVKRMGYAFHPETLVCVMLCAGKINKPHIRCHSHTLIRLLRKLCFCFKYANRLRIVNDFI